MLSHPRSPSLLLPWLATLGVVAAALAQTPSPPPVSPGPVTVLPAMTVHGESLANYPLFPKADVRPPGFGASEPPLDLFFPGKAMAAGVTQGMATVSVMLDANGTATDYLIVRYTQPYFGEALVQAAHRQKFTPRKVKGVAVPARFNFEYRFVPGTAVALSGFGAAQERLDEVHGGPQFLYEPHVERDIDGGGLALTESTVAYIPDGFQPTAGKPIRVLVTFYVDEAGRVRMPTVESAPSPLLIPNAIKAVSHWVFKPPTLKGKPVLVFAIWTVGFVAP